MSKIIKLKDGAVLLYKKNKVNKSTSFMFGVNRGGLMDNNTGISHFLEHMLFKGTKNRSYEELSDYINRKFANLNAATGGVAMYITAYESSKNIKEKIEVAADMLLNSSFDADLMEKEKQVVVHEIIRAHDDTKRLVRIEIDKQIYNYKHNQSEILGDKQKLLKITQKDMFNYVQDTMVRSKFIASVVSNLSHRKIKKLVEQNFVDKMQVGKPQELNAYKFTINTKSSLHVETIDREKVVMAIVFDSVGFSDDIASRYLRKVAKYISSGIHGPAFKYFREKNQLVYSVSSLSGIYENDGYRGLLIETKAQDVNKCFYAFRDLLNELKQGITEERFNELKDIEKEGKDRSTPRVRGTESEMFYDYLALQKIDFKKDNKKFKKQYNYEDFNKALKEYCNFDKVWVRVMGNIDKKDVYSIKKIEQILKGG